MYTKGEDRIKGETEQDYEARFAARMERRRAEGLERRRHWELRAFEAALESELHAKRCAAPNLYYGVYGVSYYVGSHGGKIEAAWIDDTGPHTCLIEVIEAKPFGVKQPVIKMTIDHDADEIGIAGRAMKHMHPIGGCDFTPHKPELLTLMYDEVADVIRWLVEDSGCCPWVIESDAKVGKVRVRVTKRAAYFLRRTADQRALAARLAG